MKFAWIERALRLRWKIVCEFLNTKNDHLSMKKLSLCDMMPTEVNNRQPTSSISSCKLATHFILTTCTAILTCSIVDIYASAFGHDYFVSIAEKHRPSEWIQCKIKSHRVVCEVRVSLTLVVKSFWHSNCSFKRREEMSRSRNTTKSFNSCSFGKLLWRRRIAIREAPRDEFLQTITIMTIKSETPRRSKSWNCSISFTSRCSSSSAEHFQVLFETIFPDTNWSPFRSW